jgi:tetrahydromethanopterin S-methyltransferase subunit G
MVDSRKGVPMAGAMDLPERVDAIEEKLDRLTASVDARFDAVDARFDAVDARFDAVDARFDAVDTRLDGVDARLAGIDARFDTVDARFDDVTSALVEQRQYTEFAFDRLRGEMLAGFAAMTTNFGRLERKLDQVIDRLLPPGDAPTRST